MTAEVLFIHTGGRFTMADTVLSFRFIKEAYTPYTELEAVFSVPDGLDTGTVTEVMFSLSSRLIHHGIADRLTVTEKDGCRTGVVSSRSFSCMLMQNQMEPGLYTRVSINSLMDNMLRIPYVTHESSADETGYIYVKQGSTLWDSLAGLAYKQLGRYPYIHGTNCVMFSQAAYPDEFSYSASQLLSQGSEVSEKRLESDFHMADINGDYGTYDLSDPDVSARNIVRHRYFELDRQFLYDPQSALVFRDKVACRGWRRAFCSYSGYNGEDLFDKVSFGDIAGERICRIEITGGRRGIVTGLSVYHDRFCN